MRKKLGLAIVGLLVLAAVVMVWLAGGPDGDPAAAAARAPAPDPVHREPATLVDPAARRGNGSPAVDAGERLEVPAAPPPAEAPVSVAGHVVDSSGRGLEGVAVKACGADGEEGSAPAATLTDSRGDFALAVAGGERPTHARFDADAYLPLVAAVPPAGPLEVVLLARPVVEGQVRDAGGAPVQPPGTVRVEVRPAAVDAAQDAETFEVELQPDGGYRADRLPSGRLVRVWARAKGFQGREVALDVELAPESRHTQDVELVRGLVVHGTVLDADSMEPVPFAKVWGEGFEFEEDSYRPSAIADAQGRYRIEGFEPDPTMVGGDGLATFWIVASSEHHAPSPLTMYGLLPDEHGEYELDLVVTRRSCSVAGSVLEPDGTTPAAGALVWSIDAENNFTFRATDAQGGFSFEGLPPGPFGLVVYRTEGDARTRHASRSTDVELAPGASEQLRLVLAEGTAEIAGRARDAAGAPVAGLEVRAHYNFHFGGLSIGLDSEAVVTDEEGRYRFEQLRAGEYDLVPAGCADPRESEFTLAAGGRRTVDFAVGECMTVAGWVDLRGESPGPFEVLLLDPATGSSVVDTQPDDEGNFELADVLARAYDLALFRDGVEVDRAAVSQTASTGIVLRAP